MQNGRTAIKSTEQLYVDGIFDARIFCGVVILGWECFPECRECTRPSGMGTSLSSVSCRRPWHADFFVLAFFLPLILLCKRRESSRLVMSWERNKITKRGSIRKQSELFSSGLHAGCSHGGAPKAGLSFSLYHFCTLHSSLSPLSLWCLSSDAWAGLLLSFIRVGNVEAGSAQWRPAAG